MTENVLQNVHEQKPESVEAAQAAPSQENEIFNKDQVSKVVAREREKAYEKGKREALMELQQQQQQDMQQQAQPVMNLQANTPMQQQPSSVGGMQQMTPDQIKQLIAEHTPQILQDHIRGQQTKQIVDSFVSKMKAAETRFPGLEEKLNELDYSTIAPIVQMANDMENTAEVMKELVDNPMKMGNLVSLVYSQPKLAAKAIRDLSSSIKQNSEAAASESQVQEPFSQLKPSSSAGMDNGTLSVKDYMKQPWLRG